MKDNPTWIAAPLALRVEGVQTSSKQRKSLAWLYYVELSCPGERALRHSVKELMVGGAVSGSRVSTSLLLFVVAGVKQKLGHAKAVYLCNVCVGGPWSRFSLFSLSSSARLHGREFTAPAVIYTNSICFLEAWASLESAPRHISHKCQHISIYCTEYSRTERRSYAGCSWAHAVLALRPRASRRACQSGVLAARPSRPEDMNWS